MANKKVRAGQTFYFVPVMIDAANPPYNVGLGDFVQVVNLPGCPKANTMGHCHVNVLMRANGVATPGTFGGLVCTNSLVTRDEYMEYLRSKITNYITEHEATALLTTTMQKEIRREIRNKTV